MSCIQAEAKPTLDDIHPGLPAVKDKTALDSKYILDAVYAERAVLETKFARARIKNVNADRNVRKTYAGRILRYLKICSAVVGATIVATGFSWTGSTLPVEILFSLMGGAALAANGLLGFTARGFSSCTKIQTETLPRRTSD